MKIACRRSFIYALFIALCASILMPQAGMTEETPREFNPGIDAASIKILKEMEAYLSPMKAFSFDVAITDEIVLKADDKRQIQKTASLVVRRPDRLRANVKFKEPKRERAFFYNGKTLTLHDKTDKMYAEIDAPATTEEALDFAMDELGFTFPVVDFIFTNLYSSLTANVFTSDYIGISQVNGVECHQLTFQQENIDWYLWIDVGDKPQPRKFLIVYKDEPQRSKYVAEFSGFKSLKKVNDNMFEFSPGKDDERIEFLPVEEEEEPLEEPSGDMPEEGAESTPEETPATIGDSEESTTPLNTEQPKDDSNPAQPEEN